MCPIAPEAEVPLAAGSRSHYTREGSRIKCPGSYVGISVGNAD
jgi:hypothetical protein